MRRGVQVMGTVTLDYYYRLIKNVLLTLLAVVTIFNSTSCNFKHKSINEMAFKARRDGMIDKYPKIPHDEILQMQGGLRVYSELRESYYNALVTLKNETDNDCAKLVVVIITPEVNKFLTPVNEYGIPFIKKAADDFNIDCIDLSVAIGAQNFEEMTQSSLEGGWSKKGSAFVADQLDAVILKYNDQRSSKRFKDEKKPETFGDLTPNQSEMVDGFKDEPYHLRVNSQGLRMGHELTFPKKKQTILILGDDNIFGPFLNNEFIATEILQKRHPDKEIINAAMSHYTMDDYESLYREKARFTEADLVLVCTNGGDVIEHYFSQRNRYSRSQKIYLPSPAALYFYNQLYGEK